MRTEYIYKKIQRGGKYRKKNIQQGGNIERDSDDFVFCLLFVVCFCRSTVDEKVVIYNGYRDVC